MSTFFQVKAGGTGEDFSLRPGDIISADVKKFNGEGNISILVVSKENKGEEFSFFAYPLAGEVGEERIEEIMRIIAICKGVAIELIKP